MGCRRSFCPRPYIPCQPAPATLWRHKKGLWPAAFKQSWYPAETSISLTGTLSTLGKSNLHKGSNPPTPSEQMCWMVFWPPLIFKRDQIPYPLWTNMLNDFLTSVYLHESFQSTGTWWAINPHCFAKGLYRTITRNLRIFAGLGKKYVPILLFFPFQWDNYASSVKYGCSLKMENFLLGRELGWGEAGCGNKPSVISVRRAWRLPAFFQGSAARQVKKISYAAGMVRPVWFFSWANNFFLAPLPTKVIFNHQL